MVVENPAAGTTADLVLVVDTAALGDYIQIAVAKAEENRAAGTCSFVVVVTEVFAADLATMAVGKEIEEELPVSVVWQDLVDRIDTATADMVLA